MLIKNGQIHDAIHEKPYTADIAVENGKIAAIAPGLAPKAGEEVVDAAGLQVYPGFVDAHTHIGLDGFGNGSAGKDFNEKYHPNTPENRGVDGFYAQDPGIREALKGGVTTVCTGPGSSNTLGGTFFAFKTAGGRLETMLLKEPVAMKCAFGENPKATYPKSGCASRMGVAARVREALYAAREYLEKKEAGKDCKFDLGLEALVPVLKKELPLKAHVHRADDILTAIRIAREFDVKMTLEHCTEGHLIVEDLVEAGFPCAIGPLLSAWAKVELQQKCAETAAILDQAGLPVCIITDAPVVLPQYLAASAGAAAAVGMDRFSALQAITIRAARHIGVEDRVGSLEVGKDADILLKDGDALDCSRPIRTVFVGGERVLG